MLAIAARDELALDRVQLVPAGEPPHKGRPDSAGREERLEMCRLLAAESGEVEVNPIEVLRPGPSFTVDTLAELQIRDPEDELTFILGADTARTLAGWRAPQEVLRSCTLAVAVREGTDLGAARSAVEQIDAEAAARMRVLSMDPVDISSSQVRRLIAAGGEVEALTGPAVARYIADRHLYREA